VVIRERRGPTCTIEAIIEGDAEQQGREREQTSRVYLQRGVWQLASRYVHVIAPGIRWSPERKKKRDRDPSRGSLRVNTVRGKNAEWGKIDRLGVLGAGPGGINLLQETRGEERRATREGGHPRPPKKRVASYFVA